MLEKTNILGALLTLVIYTSAIFVFLSRLVGRHQYGQWMGRFYLLLLLPLGYLLLTAQKLERPPLYFIQIGLMITWLIVELLLDYYFKIDFRSIRWMVIGYVVFFFAATGGMLGVAALAGRGWILVSVILFFIMGALAFIQRAITGM